MLGIAELREHGARLTELILLTEGMRREQHNGRELAVD